jgi:hypothetical protein
MSFSRRMRGSMRPLVMKDLLDNTRLAVCEKDGECPICQEAYIIGKTIIRYLPCDHSSHHQCIDLWFTRTCVVKCPLCMQTFNNSHSSNTSINSSFLDSEDSSVSVGLSVSSPNLLDRFQRGELLGSTQVLTDPLTPVPERNASSRGTFLLEAAEAAEKLEEEAANNSIRNVTRNPFGPPSPFRSS